LVGKVPWLDAASVKPATERWTANGGSRAWTDIGNHIGQLPDNALQGIAFYDAGGNVYLTVKKVGGMQDVVWSGKVGQVKVSDFPGQFGTTGKLGADFGNAIEPRVNQLVSDATKQPHVFKSPHETGLDWTPAVSKGTPANESQ